MWGRNTCLELVHSSYDGCYNPAMFGESVEKRPTKICNTTNITTFIVAVALHFTSDYTLYNLVCDK